MPSADSSPHTAIIHERRDGARIAKRVTRARSSRPLQTEVAGGTPWGSFTAQEGLVRSSNQRKIDLVAQTAVHGAGSRKMRHFDYGAFADEPDAGAPTSEP